MTVLKSYWFLKLQKYSLTKWLIFYFRHLFLWIKIVKFKRYYEDSSKHLLIKKCQKKFKLPIFIETGTYLGDTVDAVKDDFPKIYSIELDAKLCRHAQKRFKKFPHITIIYGDSGKILDRLLKDINEPCLFWLDAHFGGGLTGKGEKHTPLEEELEAILKNWEKGNVILLDDVRLFGEEKDFPTIEKIKSLIEQKISNVVFKTIGDVLLIYCD